MTRAAPRIPRALPFHQRKPKEGLRPGWHELRFRPDPKKIEVRCSECRAGMWFPPSKAGLYLTCGEDCAVARRVRLREERRQECLTCGRVFYPRETQLRVGQGRYCSRLCNVAGLEALFKPEAQERAISRMREMRAAGLVNYRRGSSSPSWKGGKAAHLKRARESGRAAEWMRTWRRKHPDKAREFSRLRGARKLGRLPRGTIPRVGAAQKWRCAICGNSIRHGYHIDHIVPLARGGQHAAGNIQLTCAACNLRKGDKDPIDYMRSLGRLL